MSSHREAPEISKDPVADSTDLYTFVSPSNPDNVVIIANYVPLESAAGGPNFYEFGDDVLYEINVDNDGDGTADVAYRFTFKNDVTNPDTFLYNTGPILSLTDKNWNRRQTYTVELVDANGKTQTLGENLASPPCNIGPLSTPNYTDLVKASVHPLPGGGQVFAGQRAEGFFVDLGAIFDLAILRPVEQLHTTFGLQNTGLGAMAAGVNATKGVNVHSIAIEVPKTQLTKGGAAPTDANAPASVIGVWTSASRQKARVLKAGGTDAASGPYVQVSRLGNPLVNEVVVPMSKKDYWNSQPPANDKQFTAAVLNPELAQLLPVLYPGVFPNLDAYNKGTPKRDDLVAIFHTGLPAGVVPGFQNSMGTTQADMLRVNLAIPPKTTGASNLGLIGNDPAGYPNGRRLFDDVVTIALRAVAGATLPLVNKSFTPDAAAGAIADGTSGGASDLTARGDNTFLTTFPYLGTPHSGFTAGTNAA
jgi:Domain of unknown function (DUF4331)